ncbi:hypothetical protein ACB092_02G215500 [Castanea dentata]
MGGGAQLRRSCETASASCKCNSEVETASATSKCNSVVGQKVPSKAIGHKVGIRNSFSLNGSSDASLDPEMMFNWINCLGTIDINSKLGQEEPLKPTNISLYIIDNLHLISYLFWRSKCRDHPHQLA